MTTMYVVGSVSQAMRGQRILQRHRVQASVRRVTDRGQQYGCGYALAVRGNAPIEQWLRDGGVTVLGTQKEGRA